MLFSRPPTVIGMTAKARRDLLERLEPLGSDGELEIGEAGDVAAGTGQVRNSITSAH